MKKIFILMTLFVSQAFAAELKLNNGESAVILANANTRVICSANNSENCETAAATFKKYLDLCYKSESGFNCAGTHWPKFKANYPNCIQAGVDYCIDYCYKSASGAACANLCQ
ncbi:MAG: hypothetical protein ACXVCP_13985 [Bdellovibrio sp.]